MKIVPGIVSTVLIGGALLALPKYGSASETTISCAAHHIPTATAEIADELVVYGKRSTASVELDRAALHIDLAGERRTVSASLERALGHVEGTVSVATALDLPRG